VDGEGVHEECRRMNGECRMVMVIGKSPLHSTS
jgi:hypothetical protein